MHQNKRGGKDFSFHSYILLILDKESQPQMKTASENELMVMMMIPFRRKSGKERPHQQRRKESQRRFHTRRKAFAFFCFFFFWFNQSIYSNLSTFSFELSLSRKRHRIFHWRNQTNAKMMMMNPTSSETD